MPNKEKAKEKMEQLVRIQRRYGGRVEWVISRDVITKPDGQQASQLLKVTVRKPGRTQNDK